MMSFRSGSVRGLALSGASLWLLSDITEAKGRHQLFVRQSPQVLKALREMALVQSVESSNRIEGVTVAPERLRPLILGNTKPRDRSEQEIQGYREALNLIHTSAQELTIDPPLLLRLHEIAQRGAYDAGAWKRKDNEIIETRSDGDSIVRFRPTSAAETPRAVEELCRLYHYSIDQDHVHPLIAAAGLVLDFLCVHPFRDGNGRVSRLLTLLALYQQGYEVGRYISLERLVEDSKEDYYRVLQDSSQGWHEGHHDLKPWTNYFLTIIRRASVEFERRAGEVRSAPGVKTALIKAAIEGFPGKFSVSDLMSTCPGVSQDMIRRVLNDLKGERRVTCLGRGPGAQWEKRALPLKEGNNKGNAS